MFPLFTYFNRDLRGLSLPGHVSPTCATVLGGSGVRASLSLPTAASVTGSASTCAGDNSATVPVRVCKLFPVDPESAGGGIRVALGCFRA